MLYGFELEVCEVCDAHTFLLLLSLPLKVAFNAEIYEEAGKDETHDHYGTVKWGLWPGQVQGFLDHRNVLCHILDDDGWWYRDVDTFHCAIFDKVILQLRAVREDDSFDLIEPVRETDEGVGVS